MSKIIYYIGAGASYGRRESRELIDKGLDTERLIVYEGLPIVSEIPQSLMAFRKAVESATIDNKEMYEFMGLYRMGGEDVNRGRLELIKDIDSLCKATKEHATIDTYAKKLYLTRRSNDFKRLKNVLCTFFVWVQVNGKIDQRYDTFLANILQIENLNIPKDISVISWNYDSQFEMAYQYYNKNGKLLVYEKNVEGEFPRLSDIGGIFKVNGSANFGDFNTVNSIIKDNSVSPIIQLIGYYGNLNADTTPMGFQLSSHLSFAWESSDKQKQLIDAISQKTKDTESIVVIGYSFPYFNREIDRKICENMMNLETIYIQDPNPEAVEPALLAALPDYVKVKIEYQKDCTQFYLPREL